jgi:tyrosyl-tRNA synthetase
MNKINEQILNRGVASIYPSREYLQSRLEKGEKLTIYLGIDPTGPNLHLGHAIPVKKLGEFQKAGHKIILLLGDFTAMIGDPTDKSATRKQLTRKDVLNNLKGYKKQLSKIISFSGKNKAELKFNSKWHSKMKFGEVLSLASQMTVQQMLERDMFKKRMIDGKPIFIHEFMYPLMQAYDSVAMNVDGEIGGNDQTFNMLCGRDMIRNIKGKEKFVMTMKLLEDPNGKKMGKTEGNMVTISDKPDDMYGKIMSWTDEMIPVAFELCTNIDMTEIEEIKRNLKKENTNFKEYKMRLAREIISVFCDKEQSLLAEKRWEKTFSKKEIPDDVEEIIVKSDDLLVDVLVAKEIVSSKSDFRRLVEGGAIVILENDEKIVSLDQKIQQGVYRIGKKRFVKFVI